MHVIRSHRTLKVRPSQTTVTQLTATQATPRDWSVIVRTTGQVIVLGTLGALCGLMGGMVMLKALAYYN